MALLESDSSAFAVVDPAHIAPVEAALDRNAATVYLARLAPGSRRTMRQALDFVASLLTGGRADALTMPWQQVRYSHAQAVRSALSERYSVATTNKALAALRGVLREAWRLGQLSAEDYQRAADIGVVRGQTLPRGRALSAGELAALLAVCERDHSAAGPRDAALIGLLYSSGLRRSEAVALDAADYDVASGALTVRQGKGRKDRVVYATNGADDALADWLGVRGREPGPLIHPVNKAGRIERRRLTGQAVLGVMRRRAAQAAVARFSPHDLRRSFVSDLLDRGADVVTVQRLAGHAGVETTARYDRRGEAAKKHAAAMLHLPYRPRSRRRRDEALVGASA